MPKQFPFQIKNIGDKMLEEVKQLLPPLMASAIETINKASGVPDEVTIQCILGVSTFACQALYDVDPIAFEKKPISNYFMCLVPSGGLKSSTLSLVMKGVNQYVKEEFDNTKDARTQYAIEKGRYDKEIKAAIKIDPNAPAVPATPFTSAVPKEPEYPRTSEYILEAHTYNGLLNAFRGVPHIGIFNPDAAGAYSGHSYKNADSQMEMVAAKSKLYSGEDVARQTGIQEDCIILSNRRLTSLEMLQPGLAKLLKDNTAIEQGITNRMLITQAAPQPAKLFDFSDAKEDANNLVKSLEPFNNRIYELLKSAGKQKPSISKLRHTLINAKPEKPDSTPKNELFLPILHFDQTARQIAQDFGNWAINEATQLKYEDHIEFMKRVYEQFCRLAAVLSAFEFKTYIGEQEAYCAVGLMKYYIAQRINLDLETKPELSTEVKNAIKLKKILLDRKNDKGETEWTRSSLSKFSNVYRLSKLADKKTIINYLVEEGFIEIFDRKNTNWVRIL